MRSHSSSPTIFSPHNMPASLPHDGTATRKHSRGRAGIITVLCAILGVGSLMAETRPSSGDAKTQGAAMTKRANGTFDVTIKPLTTDADAPLGRMSLEKRLHGDLDATSQGQMLTAMTDVEGSAGYVAIERVTGTLHGRTGSFMLQHNGSMTRATQQLSITVLPDSGTGQLTGLGGKMTITIDNGKHFYDFEYTLPETP